MTRGLEVSPSVPHAVFREVQKEVNAGRGLTIEWMVNLARVSRASTLASGLQRHKRFLNRRAITRFHIFPAKLMELAQNAVGFR